MKEEAKDSESKWQCNLTHFFYFQGCYDRVKDFMLMHYWWVIGVSVGVLALQILGIIFAFCLCKAIGSDRDYHYKYWPRAERGEIDPSSQKAQNIPQRKQKKSKKNDKNQDEEPMLVVQWMREK